MDKKKLIFAIIVIIAIVRIASLLWVQGIAPDEVSRMGMGRNFIEGTDVDYSQSRPHLYPYIIGVIYFFGGANVALFKIFNISLGILTIPVIYLLGKEIFNKKFGLYSALIFASTPFHWFYSTILKSEALLILLQSLFFLFLFRSADERKNLIPTVILLPLIFLSKFTGGMFSIFFLFYVVIFKRGYLKDKNFWLGSFFASIIGVVWMALNFKFFGHPLYTAVSQAGSTQGFGLFFYLKSIPVLTSLSLPFTLLGFYLMYRDDKENFYPLAFLTAFVFLVLCLVIGPKSFRHVLNLVVPFTIFTAYSFWKLEGSFSLKYIITSLLILIVVGNVFVTYYGFHNHPEVEKYRSLEKAGYYLQDNCYNKTVYTSSKAMRYPLWFTAQDERLGIDEIDYSGEFCVLYYPDYTGGEDCFTDCPKKYESTPEALSNLTVAFEHGRARVYVR